MLLHALFLLLIFVPLFEHDVLLQATRGGGGPGPAGGGGGGHRGTGGESRQENVRYVAVAPAAQPVVAPPKLTPPPPVPPPAPKIEVKVDVAPPPVAIAPVAGAGGGTGTDGTGGTGPGTGGGTGTGVGTGTGSANGPGTGGNGMSDTMIAHNTNLILPPQGRPSRAAGLAIRVLFSLDDRGKILRIEFPSTGDRSYDKALRARLEETTFRPAFLRSTGQPVPSIAELIINLY